MQTQTQQLKTITVQTSNSVESVHMETLYTVLTNCFNKLQLVEADCTGASYFINSANIYAQLADLYAAHAYDDYIALADVMQCFADNITYYDESDLYESCVANTAMQNVKLLDYTSLSN